MKQFVGNSMRLKTFLLISLYFTTLPLWAITTLTINGQPEVRVKYSPGLKLQLQADVGQPGNTLLLELFIDANRNGKIDPNIDADFSGLKGKLWITDGLSVADLDDSEFDDIWMPDEDGIANGQISSFLQEEAPSITHPTIIQATDQDGSTAQSYLMLILPRKDQAIVGKVVDEVGQSISGVIVFGFSGPIDLGFPEPNFEVEDIFTVPQVTVTDSTGLYRLPVDAGLIMISIFPPHSYYLSQETDLNLLDLISTREIKVVVGEDKTGIDYVLKKDSTPPVIEHQPVASPVIMGNPIRITAKIVDSESGVFPPAMYAEPKVYFRPIGNQGQFRIQHMDPSFDFDFPLDGFEPEWGNAEDVPVEAQANRVPWIAVMRQMRSQLELPAIAPDQSKPEEFVAVLDAIDVSVDGIEYYILALDNARNQATHPADAPKSLHKVLVKPSELQIQGQLRSKSGKIVPKANIFASRDKSDDHRDFEWRQIATESGADGAYLLHLPVAGLWRIFVEPESPFYVLQPESITVEVPSKRGQKVINGIDFILEMDTELPKIVHDPKTQVEGRFIGDDVIIRAQITDNVEGFVRAYLDFPSNEEDHIWANILHDGKNWTFTVLGHLMVGTFTYQIRATDVVGNLAESEPHTVTLKPPPYRVVGKITDLTGKSILGVSIDLRLESPENETVPPDKTSPADQVEIAGIGFIDSYFPMFRQATSDEQGAFKIYISPGTWYVNVHARRGQALTKKIEPLVVKTEGDYPLKIVLVEDKEKPIIVHQAEKSYKFDHQMVLEATVTDNVQLAGVYLRIFHPFEPKNPVGPIPHPVKGKPELTENEPGRQIGTPLHQQVDLLEMQVEDIPILEDLDDPHQFRQQDEIGIFASESDLDLWRSDGYFDRMPMTSTNGKTYRIDLSMYLPPLRNQINQIQYIIEAIDTAGNNSRSPADTPKTTHIISVEVNQWISGRVAAPSGKPLPYFPVFLQRRNEERWISTETDREGQYRLPAPIGKGQVVAGFGFDVGDSHLRQVVVKKDQNLDHIDFTVKMPVPTFGGGELETDVQQLSETSKKTDLQLIKIEVVDVVMDGMINIFDLVLVAKYFGQSVEKTVDESANAMGELAATDINMDGQIDIFDLTEVASHFGESLDLDEGDHRNLALHAAPQILFPPDVEIRPVIVSCHDNRVDIGLELKSNLKATGIQFDLRLQSPNVRLLSVKKGNYLSTNSFWHLSAVENNSLRRIAGVALPSVEKTDFDCSDHQVVLLSLDLGQASYRDQAQLVVSDLHLATTNGGVAYRDQFPINLDLEPIIQPQQTQLWQNYPNPFNPETWIPFELSQDSSEVSVTIYDVAGTPVRTISMGYLQAGIYVSQSRAIYWDGRTKVGERVASGTYFYTLETGTSTFTQKMIILK